MKISVTSYALPAFDGRILLRLVIDKPAEQGSKLLNYLCDYSTKIENFAREKLFLRLCELYESSYKSNPRVSAYSFTFKILCTYESENVNSYLMISRLFHGSNHLASNADAIITAGDCFVPPKLITKRNIPNSVLILDNGSRPCWADVSGGGIVYKPAGKCRSII